MLVRPNHVQMMMTVLQAKPVAKKTGKAKAPAKPKTIAIKKLAKRPAKPKAIARIAKPVPTTVALQLPLAKQLASPKVIAPMAKIAKIVVAPLWVATARKQTIVLKNKNVSVHRAMVCVRHVVKHATPLSIVLAQASNVIAAAVVAHPAKATPDATRLPPRNIVT